MIVHTSFTSESNGRFYPAGFDLLESEYFELSAEDRSHVDRPGLQFDAELGNLNEDDRFDNDNEDALRAQDDWDREHETGAYDYRN